MDDGERSVGLVAQRVLVSGRVQGVWFRESCRREAEAAGVAGWVRNLDDGSVEAWLEGPPHSVALLTEWCRQGPPHARVNALQVEERVPEGHAGFNLAG